MDLPLVDSHEITITAPRDIVWRALEVSIEGNFMLANRRGFSQREAVPPERVTLGGQHPFAAYRVAIELEPSSDQTIVRATTHAHFPSLTGKIYRALVIGSGGHAFLVERFLRRLKAVAERQLATRSAQ